MIKNLKNKCNYKSSVLGILHYLLLQYLHQTIVHKKVYSGVIILIAPLNKSETLNLDQRGQMMPLFCTYIIVFVSFFTPSVLLTSFFSSSV